MGIKHFWSWFLNNHKECITTISSTDSIEQPIDTLALDLNGLFHPVAQKIFKYGAHAPKVPSLIPRKQISIQRLRLKCFEQICETIEELVLLVQPKKRLLLCIDGVAGASKMSQQRSRRFKSAQEQKQNNITFDSCCITPGTIFMDYLSKYIDWFVRHKIQNGDWAHLDVVFSSEKVPGEGEHKALSLFKNYCDYNEHMMIYGLDADLIMLCLSAQRPNIYVYRDNMYNSKERYIINIGHFSKRLKTQLETNNAVVDFIFMCFMLGNDFLPQIPGLEILNNGIEVMMNIYTKTCKPFGLVNNKDYTIRKQVLLNFFNELAPLELESLKNKYSVRRKYHIDELMEEHFSYSKIVSCDNVPIVDCDFDAFKKDYYKTKLNIKKSNDITTLCCEYIKGLQWVIQYYCTGMTNWSWYFPYTYGPFMDDLRNCSTYTYRPQMPNQPCEPFEQLLAVLPPQSNSLLPSPLRPILLSELSPLISYYPLQFEIDMSGKRAEWEGIARLPHMNFKLLRNVYQDKKKYISSKDICRNVCDKSVRYIKTSSKEWKSIYGNITKCKVFHQKLQ